MVDEHFFFFFFFFFKLERREKIEIFFSNEETNQLWNMFKARIRMIESIGKLNPE